MSKIKKLTGQQESRFREFVKKWTAIGLSTEPANRLEAEDGIKNAYKIAGKNIPKKIVWCASPFSQGVTRAIVLGLKKSVRDSVGASVWASVWASIGASVGDSVRASVRDRVWDSVWDSVRASVRASVWASVRDSVWDSVRDSVWDSVWASVKDSVGDSVRDSVGDSVKDSVGDSVRDSVGDSVRDSVGDSVWDSVWDSVGASGFGQHDAGWLSFYDYFSEVCGLNNQTQKLFGVFKISKNAGWWLPHENICWISERHNILNRNAQGRLHCENGPALAYPDGWSIYALNGVRLTKEIVETPSEKLDSKIILKEKNAEIRREIVRKIGIERVCKQLNSKVLDTLDDYELISLDLGDGRNRPYLKMKNPSIGTYHVEGVSPEIKTVKEALNWRNQTEEEPIILT